MRREASFKRVLFEEAKMGTGGGSISGWLGSVVAVAMIVVALVMRRARGK